jgi:CDGSH-type Zn-finger protein
MANCEIRCNNNGPLIVRGEFELLDGDGKAFGLGGRKQLGLCRCGASEKKPFCDGSHNRAGFSSSVESSDLPPVGK